MFNLIKKRSTLWILIVLTLMLTFSFSYVAEQYQMSFLDALSDPGEAKALVASFNDEQIRVHTWVTAVLDVLYPLVYGMFFAGVALASFRHFGFFLAIPAFLVIPVDIAEGLVQIYGLRGHIDWLDWKIVLTPLKFGLFLIALTISVVAGIQWIIEAVKTWLASSS